MLNDQEKQFMKYWESRRDKENKITYLFFAGLPVGILFAFPVFIILFSGRYWYTRADMVANTQLSPVVLVIAVVLIAGFVAVFYKKHQWEMKDQQYKKLKARADKENG